MREITDPTEAMAALNAQFAQLQVRELSQLHGNGKRKPPRGKSKSALHEHIEHAQLRVNRNDWDGITAGDVVAVYAWCHSRVYGVEPIDLAGDAWKKATLAAANLTKQEFDGSYNAALDFVRWVWSREMGKEEWRKQNQVEERPRVTWWVQFCKRSLLMDFKVNTGRLAK